MSPQGISLLPPVPYPVLRPLRPCRRSHHRLQLAGLDHQTLAAIKDRGTPGASLDMTTPEGKTKTRAIQPAEAEDYAISRRRKAVTLFWHLTSSVRLGSACG